VDTNEFFNLLYGSVPDGALELTFIAPDGIWLKPRTFVGWKDLPFVEPLNTQKIQQTNQQGYGCYFGLAIRKQAKRKGEWRVNERTGEKRFVQYPRGWQHDAKWLTAFFVDVDAKDYGNDMKKALETTQKIRPSITVNSGGGYHCYLLLKQPLLITDENRVEIKRTLKGLSKSIGSDPHVAELARIFRIPNTINTKPGRNNALCSVMEVNDNRYDYFDLFDEYAPLEPVRIPNTQSFNQPDHKEIERALDCIPADSISYDDWITVLFALYNSLGEIDAERMAERWSGWCSQPGEISSKIASFDPNPSSPATLGSVFWMARKYGYERTSTQPVSNSGMKSQNKRIGSQHIVRMTV